MCLDCSNVLWNMAVYMYLFCIVNKPRLVAIHSTVHDEICYSNRQRRYVEVRFARC
ncbi:hypothetical protein BDQ17DRAFT_1379082 [Cyathus striatus]|nr:hypothetical protein BDQ17DRAFT_1379082 [Cyathus striatus]